MRLLGQLEEGVYIDDLEDVPPEELAEYYGVDRDADEPEQRYEHHNGDEDGDGDFNEDNGEDSGPNVPQSLYPFPDAESENLFHTALDHVRQDGIIPAGYNLLPHELQEGTYPTAEIIHAGRRGRREITVGLTHELWYPRAVQWVQAVDVLTRVLDLQ